MKFSQIPLPQHQVPWKHTGNSGRWVICQRKENTRKNFRLTYGSRLGSRIIMWNLKGILNAFQTWEKLGS